MVHFNLAGRVNSEEYAICERLLGTNCTSAHYTRIADELVYSYRHANALQTFSR